MFALCVANILSSCKPIRFYGYTSWVTDRILTLDCLNSGENSRYFNDLRTRLLTMFDKAGIDVYLDNKIVFEFSNGSNSIFIGFKDWGLSIGLGVNGDKWILDKPKGLDSLKKKQEEYEKRWNVPMPQKHF